MEGTVQQIRAIGHYESDYKYPLPRVKWGRMRYLLLGDFNSRKGDTKTIFFHSRRVRGFCNSDNVYWVGGAIFSCGTSTAVKLHQNNFLLHSGSSRILRLTMSGINSDNIYCLYNYCKYRLIISRKVPYYHRHMLRNRKRHFIILIAGKYKSRYGPKTHQ